MTDEIPQTGQMQSDQKLFPWWIMLLWGILTLIVGGMFLLNPGQTMEFFMIFLGAYWLISGLFTITSLVVDRSNMGLKIFLSVINILAGIIILVHPIYALLFATGFAIIFLGFWACFIGASHIFQAYKAKDAGNAVLGVISIIFGLLLLVNPFIAAALVPFVFGGFAVVSGIASIYVSFTLRNLPASA